MPLNETKVLKAGMVGQGMIFDETYRPFFENVHSKGLYDERFGVIQVPLTAVASRTGVRAEQYRTDSMGKIHPFQSLAGAESSRDLAGTDVDFVCIATPDDRHFEAAKAAIESGKHVLIEKPSVLSVAELDQLVSAARRRGVLAKVVYHKLLDPDHKKLRTLVADGVLRHVNNGYCSLLEPKSISGSQFAEWIVGRNPGTYVAVHYIKLIDFTFGGKLKSVSASGQRGLVGPSTGPTWDSCQMRLVYEYKSGREAAFDIHTSWVNPENFPGYVEQEVQFRFDNGIWNGHSRKRGVELTVEGETPIKRKSTINNHYNGTFLEPWGERSQRGYGIEVLERFVREVGYVEFGGPDHEKMNRLEMTRSLQYNDLESDRQTVAAVEALEVILKSQAQGIDGSIVLVNTKDGGLVQYFPGSSNHVVLYSPLL